jgi:epoxyqueuosine reductase QueG
MVEARENIKEIFDLESIEYFCFRPISEADIINSRLLPEGMKTAIVFLIPYRTDKAPSEYLAHFATVKDYHGFAKELFERIIPKLNLIYPDNRFFGFADHSPINERKLALKGNLGDIGDNGLLINEKYGSFVFIGEILTDAFFEPFAYTEKKLCTHCNRCISACPKSIANGKCISEILQQKRKSEADFDILRKTRTIWGCDICQNVCPVNESAELSPVGYFYKDKIMHPLDIIKMNNETFSKYPFSYRGRKTIEENIENIYKKDID